MSVRWRVLSLHTLPNLKNEGQIGYENTLGKNLHDQDPGTGELVSPPLETSLALIERAATRRSAAIIEVGGGESTLVDDLLARGYQNITVLDISETAIDVCKKRIGAASEQIRWLVADVTVPNSSRARTTSGTTERCFIF